MNDLCIQAFHLSKYFNVLDRKTMLLKVLTSLVKHEALGSKLYVLKDLSCAIKKGEKLALLGKNGSGKTTFLRILAGILDVNEGSVTVNGTSRILFNSAVGLNANITVLDNIYLLGAMHGILRETLKKESNSILEAAGLTALQHTLLKKLSAGQIHRLSLSIFFKTQGDLLIFDEALASVDHEFAKTCDDYFQRIVPGDTTVIMTSHDDAFLKKHCTTALWLEDGHVRMHGAFDEVISTYQQSFLK